MSEQKDIELQEDVDIQEDVVGETKGEKFKRLSAQRIQKAAKYIQALGNLSNKNSYDYTAEDVEKVFGYLQKQLDDAKAKFSVVDKKDDEFSW